MASRCRARPAASNFSRQTHHNGKVVVRYRDGPSQKVFVPSGGLVVREVEEWIVCPEEGDDGTMKGQMDVREAVTKAKESIVTIFKDEDIRDPRLEEVTFQRQQGTPTWKVTVSFVRPSFLLPLNSERTFKVVHINDQTGEVLSVTHRTLAASS